jgi:hypothetical protein
MPTPALLLTFLYSLPANARPPFCLFPRSVSGDGIIDYFEWLEGDKKTYGDALTQLIEQFIEQEEVNAKAVGTEVEFHSKVILSMVDAWTTQGMLLEKPRPKEVRAVLNELGYRQSLSIWKKT